MNRYQVCTSTCCCKHKTDAENKVVYVCVCIYWEHMYLCVSLSLNSLWPWVHPHHNHPCSAGKEVLLKYENLRKDTHILANNNHIPSKVQLETLITLLSFYTHSNTHMHKQRYSPWMSTNVSGYRHDYVLVSQSVLTIYTGSCPVGAAVAGPNESRSYSGYSVVCVKPNEEGRTSSVSVRMGYTEWP